MTFTRAMAMLSALILAGLSEAAAQFPPPPGQAAPAQSSPFPPPPGQAAPPAQSSPFPAPSGQGASAPQSSAFPPPPVPGQQARPSAPVQAQPSPFPTPGQAGAFPQTGSFSPGGPRAAPPPQAAPPAVCMQFPPIRDQTEKDGTAIKAAGDRKASREEVCSLFNKFIASEAKMVNFLVANRETCGVPPDAIKHVRGQHAKSQQMRKQICGGGGGPAAGPSLSDALGGPALPDEKPKPGRGTFDTLTGSPLAR